MVDLMHAITDIVEGFSEDSEAKEKLQDLKKEVAKIYLEKLEQEKPDLVLAVANDLVLDYLIDDGFTDKIHDAFVGNALTSASAQSADLKAFREKLNKASTAEELELLKSEIQTPKDKKSDPSPENLQEQSQVSSPSSEASPTPSTENKAENLGSAEGFNATKVDSEPARKNPKTGVTLCAATARFNAQHFGIDLPAGNARDASTAKPLESNYKGSLPTGKESKRPSKSREALSPADFDQMKDVNFADIYPDSNSKYGHRAIAFRDEQGNWMVLDPYVKVTGKENTDPKPLADYMKERKVYKGHFYNADSYKKA